MTFPGARLRSPEPGPTAGYASYFEGRDPAKWRLGVPQYDAIRYRAIYPGIDLVFHGEDGKLEYDFQVAPGASPSVIRIRFPGAHRIAWDAGEVIVDGLRHHRPVAYQNTSAGRREVAVKYRLSHVPDRQGDVRFELGEYYSALPLVIDPVITYATYAGGTGADTGRAIAVDASGNAFLAGATDSADFALLRNASAPRAYVAKLDTAGANFSLIAVLGGAAIAGLALDAAGNPVVTGSITTAAQFPGATSGAYRGGATGFVARFTQDATGLKLASIATFAAAPAGIALDSSDAIYVTGSAGTAFQTTAGALQPADAGNTCTDPVTGSGPCPDAFVLKLTTDLTKAVYATYLGGKAEDAGRAIAVDSAGDAYITGDTASSDFPVTPGAAQSNFGGRIAGDSAVYGDAFVAKLDAAGHLLFATYLGGTQPDIAYGIAVDGSGNAYVTGSTQSTDFPVSANAFQKKYAGGLSPLVGADPSGDAFIAKYSPSGALQWSTYLGGKGRDIAEAIAIDSTGNVYVTGATESADFPFTVGAGALAGCRTGGPWVAELDPSGAKLIAATSITGMGSDEPHALAVDTKGAVYVAGDATSEVFLTSPLGAQTKFGGGSSDAFAVKLDLSAATRLYLACVLNAASFQAGNFVFFPMGTVAPGEIVSLFGGSLGPATGVAALPFSSGAYPTILGGTQVLFDGIPAPMLYAGANQINAVVPFGIGNSVTKLSVQTSGTIAGPIPLQVAQTVPGVFTYDGSGIRGAAIVNQDGSLNTPSNPAPAGSIIAFYATGSGVMNPPMADGSLAPLSANQSQPAGVVSVQIGGTDVPVLYAGAAPGYVAGLLQVNVMIPADTISKCSAPLTVTIGGQSSQYGVTVAVVNGTSACK